MGGAEAVDVMFEPDPGEQGAAEDEVKEPLIGDGQNDEAGGECEEYYDEAAEIMIIWL